jgi:hypothetical protein
MVGKKEYKKIINNKIKDYKRDKKIQNHWKKYLFSPLG